MSSKNPISKLEKSKKLFESLEKKLETGKEIKSSKTGKIYKLFLAAKSYAAGNYDTAFTLMRKTLGLHKNRYPDTNIIPTMDQRLVNLGKKRFYFFKENLLF